MRYLVITDVHANLPALDAVLSTREAQSCDRILSLGDQVNYGPQPREVLKRLISLNALMLLGNHEDRFRRIDEPAFAAYNWVPLRWTWEQVKDILPEMPREIRIGSVLCTHALPGDLYRLVYPPDLPDVLDALPEDVTHLLTGHNHIRWQVSRGGRTAVNPGSLGMLESGGGGIAPFVVLDTANDSPAITCHAVPYDTGAVVRAYLQNGFWKVAPEWAHLSVATMQDGNAQLSLLMVRQVSDAAKETGLSFGDREAWRIADERMPWPDGLSSEAFWKRMECTP